MVLAIPVGALRPITDELIARDESFRRAIDSAVTVPTQAFQLWLGKPSRELGWEHDPDSVAGCFVEPLDTYCEMSHLIPREQWAGPDGVGAIAYFCGVLDERAGRGGPTPPGGCGRTRPGSSSPTLAGSGPAPAPGRAASTGPCWSIAGRVRPGPPRLPVLARQRDALGALRADPGRNGGRSAALGSSGFENLVLAGDWTKNGIDGGCVEAAVISGMQAARALTGERRPATGERTTWLAPRPMQLPAYVEYGGRRPHPGRSSRCGVGCAGTCSRETRRGSTL